MPRIQRPRAGSRVQDPVGLLFRSLSEERVKIMVATISALFFLKEADMIDFFRRLFSQQHGGHPVLDLHEEKRMNASHARSMRLTLACLMLKVMYPSFTQEYCRGIVEEACQNLLVKDPRICRSMLQEDVRSFNVPDTTLRNQARACFKSFNIVFGSHYNVKMCFSTLSGDIHLLPLILPLLLAKGILEEKRASASGNEGLINQVLGLDSILSESMRVLSLRREHGDPNSLQPLRLLEQLSIQRAHSILDGHAPRGQDFFFAPEQVLSVLLPGSQDEDPFFMELADTGISAPTNIALDSQQLPILDDIDDIPVDFALSIGNPDDEVEPLDFTLLELEL